MCPIVSRLSVLLIKMNPSFSWNTLTNISVSVGFSLKSSFCLCLSFIQFFQVSFQIFTGVAEKNSVYFVCHTWRNDLASLGITAMFSTEIDQVFGHWIPHFERHWQLKVSWGENSRQGVSQDEGKPSKSRIRLLWTWKNMVEAREVCEGLQKHFYEPSFGKCV